MSLIFICNLCHKGLWNIFNRWLSDVVSVASNQTCFLRAKLLVMVVNCIWNKPSNNVSQTEAALRCFWTVASCIVWISSCRIWSFSNLPFQSTICSKLMREGPIHAAIYLRGPRLIELQVRGSPYTCLICIIAVGLFCPFPYCQSRIILFCVTSHLVLWQGLKL